MADNIALANMDFLSTLVWYSKPNRSINHTRNPFNTCYWKTVFQYRDFEYSNFYLFTNEFWIKFKYEYSVHSFSPSFLCYQIIGPAVAGLLDLLLRLWFVHNFILHSLAVLHYTFCIPSLISLTLYRFHILYVED